jgi:hypothetical protein
MELPSKMILAAAGGGAAAVVVLLVGFWLIWRRRAANRSKYGFSPGPDTQPDTGSTPADLRGQPAGESEDFIRKRGQRVADVLLDYAKAKGLGPAVFLARLEGDAAIWWLGERVPQSNKGIIAAVHIGRRPGKGFRAKVVVLKAAEEATALAAALKRAAKPRDEPMLHDSWGRPISFDGFPLSTERAAAALDLSAQPEQPRPASGKRAA